MRPIKIRNPILRAVGSLFLTQLVACTPAAPTKFLHPDEQESPLPPSVAPAAAAAVTPLSPDIQRAVAALDSVEELVVGEAGTPTLIRGNLGRLAGPAESMGQPSALAAIAPLFGLSESDLTHVTTERDELGFIHSRHTQIKNGLPVRGAEVIVHANAQGLLYAVNGTARSSAAAAPAPSLDATQAVEQARRLTPGTMLDPTGQPRLVYLPQGGALRLCWELELEGEVEAGPLRDRIFIDALSGELAERHPLIHSARNRNVYTASGSATLPGTLGRREGGAIDLDSVINANYDRLGATYSCYADLFGRDSYDGRGAELISTTHYGSRYNNAFWNGTQMVYGDGDGTTFGNFATSMDVTAHELTHAVTERSAGLVYLNESGALNESMSDVFGNVCEAYQNGVVDARTWMVGEDVYTPATAGDALRYMNDPTRDGSSRDYYPERYIGSADNGGVHSNSGIANLAFYLLSQGGSHPRSKTRIVVPAQGISKARQIWYRALTRYMTSGTTFKMAQDLTAQAALDLYGEPARDAVIAAWQAVGVGRSATLCARSSYGVICATSNGSAFNTTSTWQDNFSDVNGWNRGPEYYGTIQYPDLNGDGRADLCGRGNAGLYCALSTGRAFTPISLWLSELSDANGWNNGPEYYSTIQFADLNGDGRADVCGRGNVGIYCAISTGSGFGAFSLWDTTFTDANGWNAGPQYYSTIQLADVNGDGKADVCGRGSDGVYCALSTGSNFNTPTHWLPDLTDGNGWNAARYYSTMRFVDLNADGRADICVRGSAGMDCALSTGSSFGTFTVWQGDFSDGGGWGAGPYYYSTFRFADLNGDGKTDVCGRGSGGVYCALSTGTTFGPTSVWHAEFSDRNGWGGDPQYYSTIQLADVNGDGKADVCGRASSCMVCALSDGTSFGALGLWQSGFTDASGWGNGPQYYSTLRFPFATY